MKAWRMHGIGDLRLDEVPLPEVKPGWVLIKVRVLQPSVTEVQQLQGKMIGMGILGTHAGMFIKTLIIVDDDIDPFNINDVLWAVSTRFQPDSDLEVIRNVNGYPLDASIPSESRQAGSWLTSKMIIDATKPVTRPFAQVVAPEREVMEKVNREWERYGIS